MTPASYRDYVAAFNARDYDKVCSYLAPDVALYTEGHTIRGHAGIRNFYRFFHAYVTEHITPTAVVGDDRYLFAEAVMHLTGLRELSQEVLNATGYPRFTPVPQGLTVDVILFLHYELENGLVQEIRCASYRPPDMTA